MTEFILLTRDQAKAVEGWNEAGTARLEPVLVEEGPHAGKYILPLAVLEDASHAMVQTHLEAAQKRRVDLDEAWASNRALLEAKMTAERDQFHQSLAGSEAEVSIESATERP